MHEVRELRASVHQSTDDCAKDTVSDFSYNVDHPRRRVLLAVRRIETSVAGRDLGTRYETELEAEIEAIRVVDKLHIDRVSMHMLSTFDPGRKEPVVTTRGNRIEGVRLGNVEARVEFDDEPLSACGNKAQLAGFY